MPAVSANFLRDADMTFATLERDFFRYLNALVEPAVRRGIGSPRFTPASRAFSTKVGARVSQVGAPLRASKRAAISA